MCIYIYTYPSDISISIQITIYHVRHDQKDDISILVQGHITIHRAIPLWPPESVERITLW